jgi:hypothetical protein
METSDVPAMYMWNSIAAAQRMLRPDGLLSGARLRQAIRHKLVLKCGYGATAIFMRTTESAIRKSVGRAERRGLLDWGLIESMSDIQLEKAAYTRLPRTSRMSAWEAMHIRQEHFRKMMEEPCAM